MSPYLDPVRNPLDNSKTMYHKNKRNKFLTGLTLNS